MSCNIVQDDEHSLKKYAWGKTWEQWWVSMASWTFPQTEPESYQNREDKVGSSYKHGESVSEARLEKMHCCLNGDFLKLFP